MIGKQECNFKNIENTLLTLIASLLINKESDKLILGFIDNSKLEELSNNQFVVKTKQGSYKISVEEFQPIK